MWFQFGAGRALKSFTLRQELEEVAAENPDRFKLWYTIDRYSHKTAFYQSYQRLLCRPGDGWKYSSGFINAEMIEKALFPPSEDNLVTKTDNY